MAVTLVRMCQSPVLRRMVENSNYFILAKENSQVNFKLPRHRALRPWNAKAKLPKPTKFNPLLIHNTKAVFWGSQGGPWRRQAAAKWRLTEWFLFQ